MPVGLCRPRHHKQALEQRNVLPLLDLHPHPNKADLYKIANRYSNFFKHARDDPDAVLDDFDKREADAVLFIAVNDFHWLRGGMPIEARIFGMWFVAWFDPSQHGKEFADRLVGIETMPRPMQLALGKSFLEWARERPEFREAPYSDEIAPSPVELHRRLIGERARRLRPRTSNM